MTSYVQKKETVERKWYVVDAAGNQIRDRARIGIKIPGLRQIAQCHSILLLGIEHIQRGTDARIERLLVGQYRLLAGAHRLLQCSNAQHPLGHAPPFTVYTHPQIPARCF